MLDVSNHVSNYKNTYGITHNPQATKLLSARMSRSADFAKVSGLHHQTAAMRVMSHFSLLDERSSSLVPGEHHQADQYF